MKTAFSNPLVENYFAQMGSKMADLPEAQRREFLLELRAQLALTALYQSSPISTLRH